MKYVKSQFKPMTYVYESSRLSKVISGAKPNVNNGQDEELFELFVILKLGHIPEVDGWTTAQVLMVGKPDDP